MGREGCEVSKGSRSIEGSGSGAAAGGRRRELAARSGLALRRHGWRCRCWGAAGRAWQGLLWRVPCRVRVLTLLRSHARALILLQARRREQDRLERLEEEAKEEDARKAFEVSPRRSGKL